MALYPIRYIFYIKHILYSTMEVNTTSIAREKLISHKSSYFSCKNNKRVNKFICQIGTK